MHTALQHGGGVDPGGSSCEEGKRRDPVAQRLSPAGASARAGASVVVSVVIRPAGRMTTDTGRSGIRMTFHGFPKHNPGSTPLHAISYTLDAARIGDPTPLPQVFQALIGPDSSRDSGKACRRSLKTSPESQHEDGHDGHGSPRWPTRPPRRPMVQAVPDEPDRIVFVRPLPGDALIEWVVRCRLSLRVELALLGIGHLPQRRAPGRRDRRR
jgi:hypothetical protein